MRFWEISIINWIHVYHYWRSYLLERNCHLEGSPHWLTACVKTISKTLLFSLNSTNFVSILVLWWCIKIRLTMFFVKSQSLSEYMYVIICVHIYLHRNFHLEGSTHWLTACVKTISKTLLFSLNYTNSVSILVLRWCI